jgi:uncharacterized membrane protein
MEAFTDGVLAIIITIMVLELKVPHGTGLEVLRRCCRSWLPTSSASSTSGIYWNNHHHMLHACHRVTGLGAVGNLHLLVLALLGPLATGWMGENHFATMPTAAYGVVLLMAGRRLLDPGRRIIAAEGEASLVKRAIGRTGREGSPLCCTRSRSGWRSCRPGSRCGLRGGGDHVVRARPAAGAGAVGDLKPA